VQRVLAVVYVVDYRLYYNHGSGLGSNALITLMKSSVKFGLHVDTVSDLGLPESSSQ